MCWGKIPACFVQSPKEVGAFHFDRVLLRWPHELPIMPHCIGNQATASDNSLPFYFNE